jgi:signal transduction histidine kinase
VLALVRQQIRERAIAVQLELDPVLPPVAGSSQELMQVILNLVLNAVEAMPSGGDLVITTSATAERVAIAVQDNGVGIPPENLSQIFEPFFTMRVSGAGTGLGLYISKNIVEMHQGSITVQSEPQQGARFTVTLPRA